MFSRRGDAVAGALGDESLLEVRDRAEDVEHELAGGRGGVETLLETDQVDVAGLEAVDGLEQLPERAPQTVEAGDAQAVAGTGDGGINICSGLRSSALRREIIAVSGSNYLRL